MRIDKFLKVSRILKRRALAVEAGKNGRIEVNRRTVKPAHQIKVGDIVSVHFNSGSFTFEILDIKETVKKEQAESLYKVIEE